MLRMILARDGRPLSGCTDELSGVQLLSRLSVTPRVKVHDSHYDIMTGRVK